MNFKPLDRMDPKVTRGLGAWVNPNPEPLIGLDRSPRPPEPPKTGRLSILGRWRDPLTLPYSKARFVRLCGQERCRPFAWRYHWLELRWWLASKLAPPGSFLE
jgi:hypothetical protein